MTKKICFFLLIFSFLILRSGFSQTKGQREASVSGFIMDSRTGESLTGAVVYPREIPSIGITSNAYGYFSLSLPAGKYSLLIQFMGYKTKTITVDLKDDMKLDVEMEEESIALNEVTVTGEKNNINVVQSELISKINVREIQNIPVILGEKDILKTIQLLPGITPAGEGNAGFFVRGGGVDQNLILLDEAPVYNPSHLLGFFSTFNSDAIKDIALIKVVSRLSMADAYHR